MRLLQRPQFWSIPVLLTVLTACSDPASTPAKPKDQSDTAANQPAKPPKLEAASTQKPPIINITDTVRPAMQVLVIKDSAANTDRIGLKLNDILGVRLAAFMKKAKVKPVGPPMAWYQSQEPPFFFEAGIPVDKKPAKLDQGILLKSIQKDSVMVAHFYGPYELSYQAYTAIEDLMKEKKRKPAGAPVEIYVDDPLDANGKPKDPYKVLTDIVFPFKK